ncbi:hypothetical protein GF360_03960 [candidate division WWE3 bacterium]|nr:hypothetical protein [candidate division WWE3 bacterium]
MNLPAEITIPLADILADIFGASIESLAGIGNITVYTQGLFLIAGFLFSLYPVWREGRKDGFDEEKLFDKYLLSLVAGLLVSRAFYAYNSRYLPMPLLKHTILIWKPGVSFPGFLLGFIATATLLVRASKWSLYRILDIFALALAFGGSIAFLSVVGLQKDFSYLVLIGILLIFYGVFSALRLKRIFSGFAFVAFLLLVVIAGILLGHTSMEDLLFHGVLFTISMLVLILRVKKLILSKSLVRSKSDSNLKSKSFMSGKNLPKSLIDSLKKTLQKKNDSLEKQEKLLDSEDPYMQEGRAEDNSEMVDDAYLEDTFKTVIDAQKRVLGSVKSNVQKALGKLSRGEYGVCEKCGEDIDPARLKAYPEAHLCSECARRSEASSS